MRAVALLVTLFFAVWSSACSSGPAPRGVLLVVIDTLRADHLGIYGYSRPTSPHLDALARDAVVFRNAVSPSPWTLPALATIMTSLYPSVHGADRYSPVNDARWLFDREGFVPTSALHESRTTLAEVLGRQGIATAGFVQGSFPSAVFGLAQGFDHYRDNDTPGIRFDIEDLLAWLDTEQPERFFIYLHTVEVHSPYTPIALQPLFAARRPQAPMDYYETALEEERERFESIDFDPGYDGPVTGTLENIQAPGRRGRPPSQRDLNHLIALYDRGIAYTDYWMGRLFEELKERGLYDETLLIVTSDHGDEFLEHGGLEHGRTYFEEMLRVPLIIRDPREGHGQVIEQQVGLIDILPSVLDAVGIPAELRIQGRSLRPLWLDESLPEQLQVGEASVVPGLEAVRTNRWKYVRRERAEAGQVREALFDLEEDPGERVNRCPIDPTACGAFRRKLQAWKADMRQVSQELALPQPEPARLDDEARERLRALGYAEP
jgi:arylsulfatase A-like enzyme